MSEVRRSQRLATDFSIARILAANEPSSSSSSSQSQSTSGTSNSSLINYSQTSNRMGNKSPVFNCPCCPSSALISKPEVAQGSFDNVIEEDKSVELISGDKKSHVVPESVTKIGISVPGNSRDCFNNGEVNDLPWLHCTRYRPPRLPKRSSAGKVSKRRPGKHPRIPFTAFQLQILEEKYSKGAYLARRDVVQLSLVLRLPQSRVKIWFQNRRARERRESLQLGNDPGKSETELNNT